VDRVPGGLVVGKVAADALGGGVAEPAAGMAAGAFHPLVRPIQREASLGMVDARGWSPGVGAVARATLCGEPARHVIWRPRALVVRLVATVAIGRRALVAASRVTACASHPLMRAGQGEAGLRMIEGGGQPRCGCMARNAGG